MSPVTYVPPAALRQKDFWTEADPSWELKPPVSGVKPPGY